MHIKILICYTVINPYIMFYFLLSSMFVCLPYKYENEKECTIITAISKVDGSYSVFIEVQDFVIKINFIMPLEL